MPGRLHSDFRSGNLTEELGVLLLKGFAAVAAVPRQEDVGIDAIATLLRPGPDDMLIAENSFYVQFKSAADRQLVFVDHALRWLENLELPYFIGSVRKEDSACDLYATHRVSQILIEGRYDRLELNLDRRDDVADGATRGVSIGPPLLAWSTHDLARPDFASSAYDVLKLYLEAEQLNIDYRSIRYVKAIAWETGKHPKIEEGELVFGSVSEVELRQIMQSMSPYLKAMATRAMLTQDRDALGLALQVIEYMRRNSVDPDPSGTFRLLYDRWEDLPFHR